jgi:hypothetical protein
VRERLRTSRRILITQVAIFLQSLVDDVLQPGEIRADL